MLSDSELITAYFENTPPDQRQSLANEIGDRLTHEAKSDGIRFAMQLCNYQLDHPRKMPFDVPMQIYQYVLRTRGDDVSRFYR